jgi:hypothetical protein
VEDFALTPSERALFAALAERGLGSFASEYPSTVPIEIDGLTVQILSLERVIASKREANRAKDQAALPALEATPLAKRRGHAED